MQSLLDSIINQLPVPTVFEMTFGLILSLVLFLIDRSGKVRQEETLQRQDESLDIILEQVSKVNIFQTRTLSLAIESLNSELKSFRTDIDLIKTSLDIPKKSSIDSKIFDKSEMEVEDKESNKSNQEKSLTSSFGDILSQQVNTFIDQMKTNLSELAKNETVKQQEKNLYKVKKGLEFDMKDLINIQSMLKNLHPEPEGKNQEQVNDEDTSNEEEKEIFTPKINESQIKKTDRINSSHQNNKSNFSIENFDEQLEHLDSLPDIIKLTESFIKNFEKLDSSKNKELARSGTKTKKKVKPSKIVSKNDSEYSDSSS